MDEHELFAAALEIDTPDERSTYLDRACGGDAGLRGRVEDLLRAYERAGSFLSAPPVAGPATLDAPGPLEVPGTVVGPYKILQRIGEGGMGAVYMAEQVVPVRRLVALKLIKPGMDSRQVLARFGAERQALALMDHPNIAKVLDAGATEQGRPYFVMELVKGVPITRYCDDRRLTLRERLELFVPVCHAVQHAHQKGVIHRDLKPSNILVAQYDGRPVPKVIDFGVAKATGLRLTEATLYTEFGSVVGTLEYMSPEQAELNQLDIDTRSDVYSLGAILYELLTGSTPLGRERLRAGAFVEMLRIIREEDSPLPSARLSTMEELPSIAACRQVEPRRLSALVRGELDWIVMKALEKDRSRRYETANSLAMDLQHYLTDEPVQACPPSAWYRFSKFARRNRAALVTASVVAAALVAVAMLSVFYADRQRRYAVDKEEAARKIAILAGDLETSLSESNRLLALRSFDRGQAAFEKDQIGPGLLWMIESWRSAVAAGDPAWQHAARANLAAWQPYQPRLRAIFSHSGPVEHAVFSPDCKRVLTASEDGTARLWDVGTGRPITAPLKHQGSALGAAISPDGRTLYTGGTDRMVRLWNAVTGQQLGSPLQHPSDVLGLALSPDGETLATGCADGMVHLWDVATRTRRIPPFRVRRGSYKWVLAFSPDSKFLITPSVENRFLWDAATGRPVGPTFNEGARSVALSSDGKILLTGRDFTARLWDAVTGQPLTPPLRGHDSLVSDVAFRPDGAVFLTASPDKTARLWDAATGEPVGLPLQHPGPVRSVAFSPDGRSFLTASGDGEVRVWETGLHQPVRLVVEETYQSKALAFSPDSKLILAGNMNGAQLWDAARGSPVGPPLRHFISPFFGAVAFSPDGRTVLTGGNSDKTARMWDVASCQPVGPPLVHQSLVIAVAFSPDSKTITTASGDGMVQMWYPLTGAPVGPPLRLSAGPLLAISPDGRTCVVASGIGTVQWWDVATRTPLGERFLHPGTVEAVAFSPDGRAAVLTSGEDGMARLWDAASGTLLLPPLANQNWIWSVAFSTDGGVIAVGNKDSARLWDAATGQPIGPALRHPGAVNAVIFSPDGKTFLTECNDSRLRLFVRPPEVPDDLERVATWVEIVTGLTLDRQRGQIQALDQAAWLERRDRLERLGGSPETGPDRRLDPILQGPDPTARARSFMDRKLWGQADAAFAEAITARPFDMAILVERGDLYERRGLWSEAASYDAAMVRQYPDAAPLHERLAIARLLAGDLPGYRAACAGLLERFESLDNSVTAGRVAHACSLAPEAVADLPGLVRVSERSTRWVAANAVLVGAVLFRAGRLEEALKHFEKMPRTHRPRASDCLFLAMIHAGLGHPGEAHRWLQQADQWVLAADKAPPDAEGDGPGWTTLTEKPIALLLRREAEARLSSAPSFPADPFAH
jgi:WD40 repeat protein/serine/threonine protein kinase/tetratricopeptide (TPR) repeat protein